MGELAHMAKERDVWGSLLDLLLPMLRSVEDGGWMDRWMDITI